MSHNPKDPAPEGVVFLKRIDPGSYSATPGSPVLKPKPFQVEVVEIKPQLTGRLIVEVTGDPAYLDGMFDADGTYTIETAGRRYVGVPCVNYGNGVVCLELDKAVHFEVLPS